MTAIDRGYDVNGTLHCHWEMPTDAAHLGATSASSPTSYVYPDDFPILHVVTFVTDSGSPYTVYFRCENDFPSNITLSTTVSVLVRYLYIIKKKFQG